MKNSFFKKHESGGKRGSALIEVVVMASILAVVAVALLGSFALLSRFHERNMMTIKGELLAEEGLEILRFAKSSGWSTLTAIPVNQARYFSVATSSWSITTIPEVVDGVFSRSFKLYSVNRDVNYDIVSSGGVADPDTLLAEVTVAWVWRNATSTAIYKAYVTNL